MGKRKSPDFKINAFAPEYEAAEKAAKEGEYRRAAEKGESYFKQVAGVLGISLISLRGLFIMRREVDDWEDRAKVGELSEELDRVQRRIKTRE